MKRHLLLGAIAAGALIAAPAWAQGVRTNQNLEPTCQNTGGGMDPRCIGDVTPNTERGAAVNQPRTAQMAPSTSASKPRRKAVDCRMRVNRNKAACRH